MPEQPNFTNHPLNVNNVKTNKLKNVNVSNVRATANKLVQTFDEPGSFNFFCKVARSLPEHVIWTNMEQAKINGRKPIAYFIAVCETMINT